MSCTNPSLLSVLDIHRCNIGDRERLEKQGYKFSEDLNKAYKFCVKESKTLPLEHISQWVDQKMIEIPCGSCLACRLDYSADWAIRCQFEAKLWKHNYFLTLTYDDVNLPIGESGNATLVKEHISDFIKALRNYFAHRGHTGIRYLLCGEYNSSGERILNPHYHLILFNCPLPDLTVDFPTEDGCVIHKFNSAGLPMFYSPLVADIWSKGYITVDDANYNTEAYVSRYIMKKQKGSSSSVYTDFLGVIPPFLRMSNRPGIGFNQFLLEKDNYLVNPLIILPGNKKARISGLPKYFKRSLFKIDPSQRSKFEDVALNKDRCNKAIRAAYGTTSNYQKQARESHLTKITTIFDRNGA